MAGKKYEIDMTTGTLLSKIFLFALPLMASSMLQLVFNAADTIVVGRFAGATALAAVGATGSLINLLINMFLGLSVGTNVLMARYYGSRNNEKMNEVVHTSILLSILVGVVLVFVGIIVARPVLTAMGTPSDCLDQAVLYMRIYFMAMPIVCLYNFGSSILRAVGDTRRPLYYLAAAGVVNVGLNLVFVIVFGMGVAGVALATDISQCLSAFLVLRCLIKTDEGYKLEIKKLRIVKDEAAKIFKIGVPAGVQGMLFSISNILIQSSINSFGSLAVAGNTAGSNVEFFVYFSMNAFSQASLSFSSQNYGAGKIKRVNRVLIDCQILSAAFGVGLGLLALHFGDMLLGLYTDDPEVIQYGLVRMGVILTTYCTCGMMDIMSNQLRAVGFSITPVIICVVGVCGFRILWLYTVFAQNRTLDTLYYSYPISWTITMLAEFFVYLAFMIKLKKSGRMNFGTE
ncbi:MAG: MATE family efflux transporter [Lachnospiraceae bacterium]|nr:MATE family efflux transporter [Lachnospiraceae bacterium]